VGLLYAGMCAAILFGKVNRVQCHANVKFCNAVCLLYEPENESYHVDSDDSDSDDEEAYSINKKENVNHTKPDHLSALRSREKVRLDNFLLYDSLCSLLNPSY
jgi:hypothetical protein